MFDGPSALDWVVAIFWEGLYIGVEDIGTVLVG
jgi:hypothetical protein